MLHMLNGTRSVPATSPLFLPRVVEWDNRMRALVIRGCPDAEYFKHELHDLTTRIHLLCHSAVDWADDRSKDKHEIEFT